MTSKSLWALTKKPFLIAEERFFLLGKCLERHKTLEHQMTLFGKVLHLMFQRILLLPVSLKGERKGNQPPTSAVSFTKLTLVSSPSSTSSSSDSACLLSIKTKKPLFWKAFKAM